MTIVVDSGQWTGEHDDAAPTSPVVWGEFADRETLDRAAERLREEAWFREANARTEAGAETGRADNDQVITPDENPLGADARNLRQNVVGTAAASTSMLAAGVVVATGGAALPAVAAAAAVGAATFGAGEVVGKALEPEGTGRRPEGGEGAARAEGLALGIRANTEELRGEAEAYLRNSGARRVWVRRPGAG